MMQKLPHRSGDLEKYIRVILFGKDLHHRSGDLERPERFNHKRKQYRTSPRLSLPQIYQAQSLLDL